MWWVYAILGAVIFVESVLLYIVVARAAEIADAYKSVMMRMDVTPRTSTVECVKEVWEEEP